MKELTYFNGEFVEPGAKCVSLDDRGYCFGDGVYEVTRVLTAVALLFVPSGQTLSLHALHGYSGKNASGRFAGTA